MCGGPAFAFLLREVRRVSVNGKNHVAGFVANARVGVCGNVVEKLLAGFGNCFGAVGLSGGDGAEGGEEG